MGEGGRGDGGKKFMMRQVQPATETAAPPSGITTAGLSGNAGASPPRGARLRPLLRCRPGSGAGVPGAVAPGEINQKSPPSPWGKSALRARVGGMGEKPCDMAGKSGDQNRRAPHRGQRRQGYPATPGQAPARRRIAPPAPVPPGFSLGDARGEAPCIRKPKNSPFPTGEGGRGDRGKKFMMWQAQPATEKSSHPSKPTAAKKTVSRRRRTPLPPPALSQHPPQDSRDEPSGATDAPHTAGSA